MSPEGLPPPPPPPPPPSGRRPAGQGGSGRRSEQGWPKWSPWILVGVFLTVLVLFWQTGSTGGKSIAYSDFTNAVRSEHVQSVTYNNTNGRIEGRYKDDFQQGGKFTTTGPIPLADTDR